MVSLHPLDINKLISQLIQKYRWAENSAKINSGTFPVFFTPKAVGKAIAKLWKTVLSGQAIVQCCPKCGTVLDRDENAAINILNKALHEVGIILSACGGVRRWSACKTRNFSKRGFNYLCFVSFPL